MLGDSQVVEPFGTPFSQPSSIPLLQSLASSLNLKRSESPLALVGWLASPLQLKLPAQAALVGCSLLFSPVLQ